MTNRSITPTPQLRQLWAQEAQRLSPHDPVEWMQYVSEKAAQWGADTELEACCEWFIRDWTDIETADRLRAARRPKLPSLAEQALEAWERQMNCYEETDPDMNTIRRGLERLKSLEDESNA